MEKTKIEWADSSWNPVTGCYHQCPYCYARGIANRFSGSDETTKDDKDPGALVYLTERQTVTTKAGKVLASAYPYGFTPTFHQYRLNDPLTKGFGKTIFVCSMADLFGDWVPDEWIRQVFDACKQAPNHRYLFLTKNPRRYIQLAAQEQLPQDDNFWYGTTVTTPYEGAFFSDYHHTFLSIEPILAPFGKAEEFSPDGLASTAEWAILGAETGNRQDKVVPAKDWVFDVVLEFHKRNKPVFMKDSMIPIWGDDIYTEFPWND